MSDEQERDADAAVIKHCRQWRVESHSLPSERIELYVQIEGYALVADAALREIDRLTAERDAARAELAKLKETVRQETLNLESLANWFDLDSDYRSRLERLRDAVTAIRAALGSEVGE